MLRRDTHALLHDWMIAYANRETLNPSLHLTLRYENQYATVYDNDLAYVTSRYVTLRYAPLRYVTLLYVTLRYVPSVNKPLLC